MRNRFLSLLLTVIVIAALSLLPLASAYAEDPRQPELLGEDEVAYYLMPYLIVRGDTLSDIYHCWGLRYETYADDICSLNDLTDLDSIQAGWLLYLPTNEKNLMGSDYTTVVAHTVEAGETAYDVCHGYGMDYDSCEGRIQQFNSGLDLARLKTGQVLHIPLL